MSYKAVKPSGLSLVAECRRLVLQPSGTIAPVEKARDAGTGKFVTKDSAKSHPKTTVVEKVKVGPTKHRK